MKKKDNRQIWRTLQKAEVKNRWLYSNNSAKTNWPYNLMKTTWQQQGIAVDNEDQEGDTGGPCDGSLLRWAPCYRLWVKLSHEEQHVTTMSDEMRSQATLFALFRLSCFHNVPAAWREEPTLFLCVSAFIFHSKMMEIMIGSSLLWLLSARVQKGDDSCMAMFDFTPMPIADGAAKNPCKIWIWRKGKKCSVIYALTLLRFQRLLAKEEKGIRNFFLD